MLSCSFVTWLILLFMALIVPVLGYEPLVGKDCFLAPNATLIGQVILGERCSVWFGAIIRADVNRITIGDFSNIQDGAVLHATYQKSETVVHSYVSIGHNAIVHGCTLMDHVLVGMGSIVMDGAVVEPYCIIAAGAVVLEGMVCSSGYLYAGIPAKKIKPISDEQKIFLDKLPTNYLMYADWFSS